jgi:hypothetical protein
MKIRDVVSLREVADDLVDGRLFYERQEPGIGDYFFNSLISDLESLKLYAGIHPRRLGFYRMFSRRFPFAIYYEVKGDIAQVVAVLDMRRDSAWTREKLEQRGN